MPLKLTLKELYTGTTKKLKITRKVYNKQTNKLEEKEVSKHNVKMAHCKDICYEKCLPV